MERISLTSVLCDRTISPSAKVLIAYLVTSRDKNSALVAKGWGIRELARATGMHHATVAASLNAHVAMGYVIKANGKYYLPR